MKKVVQKYIYMGYILQNSRLVGRTDFKRILWESLCESKLNNANVIKLVLFLVNCQ